MIGISRAALFFLLSAWCLSGFFSDFPIFTSTQLYASGLWHGQRKSGHTGKHYPDIRGQKWTCGKHVTKQWRKSSFVCDPDGLLNKTDVLALNNRLHRLTNTTPCHCQRRSQCTSSDKDGKSYFVGFVVAIALARKLHITYHDPTEQQLKDIATKFSETVLGRWALGDCGNSALIFVWEEYKKMYIITGRVTAKYLTNREAEMIQVQVKALLIKNAYTQALHHAIVFVAESIQTEMMGEPETKVDAGTLALIISVGVAVIIVLIITGCVCAFRCCGNLRPGKQTPLERTLERVDSLKAEVIRRGSQLRRSFSRSPKFPRRSSPSQVEEATNSQTLGYYAPGTSLV